MSDAPSCVNLPFGVLSVQTDFITLDAVVARLRSWVLDNDRTLSGDMGKRYIHGSSTNPVRRDDARKQFSSLEWFRGSYRRGTRSTWPRMLSRRGLARQAELHSFGRMGRAYEHLGVCNGWNDVLPDRRTEVPQHRHAQISDNGHGWTFPSRILTMAAKPSWSSEA